MAQRSALQEITTVERPSTTDHVLNVFIDLPLTPVSPDEELIRLRGRYRPSAVVQPTITKTIDEIQLTPKKTPRKSPRKCKTLQEFTPSKSPNIIIRTSPRKRLNLQDVLQNYSFVFNDSSDSFPSTSRIKTPSKRSKLQSSSKLTVTQLTQHLSTLSHPQLIDLMKMLLSKHPEIQESLEEEIPSPDLSPLEEKLNALQRNIFRSIPSTRWESNRDSFCFRRTSSHLQAFKNECLEQSRKFLQHEQWETALDYILIAWRYVRTLPDWDNPAHNKVKTQCFKALASICLTSLKKGDFEESEMKEMVDRFTILAEECEYLIPCMKYLEENFHQMKP